MAERIFPSTRYGERDSANKIEIIKEIKIQRVIQKILKKINQKLISLSLRQLMIAHL